MDQLISIIAQQVADDTFQTVDTRELHAFLEVGQDFTNWIKGRESAAAQNGSEANGAGRAIRRP